MAKQKPVEHTDEDHISGQAAADAALHASFAELEKKAPGTRAAMHKLTENMLRVMLRELHAKGELEPDSFWWREAVALGSIPDPEEERSHEPK